jgi:hypothetical protein
MTGIDRLRQIFLHNIFKANAKLYSDGLYHGPTSIDIKCMQDCTSSEAKVGSGIWVGTGCSVDVQGCSLNGNESYGIEASHKDAVARVTGCTFVNNIKGDTDAWDSGKIYLDNKPTS